MRRTGTATASVEDEESLSARAAWLHFVGALSQGEVAERLNITGGRAHRLITRASRAGLVQVFVRGEIASCARLEDRLRSRYGLSICEVAPDTFEGALPLRALGAMGARFLRQVCERGDAPVIGLGYGRTLAACVTRLPPAKVTGVRFVSLLGGFTRRFAANPFDVISVIAARTGAESHVLPVPFCTNTRDDRAVLMAQPAIGAALDLARRSTPRIVGIGTVNQDDASLAASGMVERGELADIARAGGRGELLGHFFDARGRPVSTDLSERLMSLTLDDLRKGRTVAIAGGSAKPPAVRAVLESGMLQGLLTDERTADALVESG